MVPARNHKLALDGMKKRGLWNGSFNGRESTLQQLSPYIGKLKTGIVRSLISHFSSRREWICDPFCGSGVVALQALIMGRRAMANDLSRYAVCLTKGKLSAPMTLIEAENYAARLINYVERNWNHFDMRHVDPWVRSFFHPRTLKETLAGFEWCPKHSNSFL